MFDLDHYVCAYEGERKMRICMRFVSNDAQNERIE